MAREEWFEVYEGEGVGVVWKTYRVLSLCFVDSGWWWFYGGSRTWEVTVKGPNFMSLVVRDAIVAF